MAVFYWRCPEWMAPYATAWSAGFTSSIEADQVWLVPGTFDDEGFELEWL